MQLAIFNQKYRIKNLDDFGRNEADKKDRIFKCEEQDF